MIPTSDITGLILAGGRGSRMGGVDKGLQVFNGAPMAMHALMRLSPQVGHVLINANRNLAAYESFGVPVVVDAVPDFAGPLAGILAGLRAMPDTLPADRAVRLAFRANRPGRKALDGAGRSRGAHCDAGHAGAG